MAASGACTKMAMAGMFIANFLILATGIICVVIGAWIWIDSAYLAPFLDSGVYTGATCILIIMGLAKVFVSFIGFLGATRLDRFTLLTAFFAQMLILIIALAGVICAYCTKDNLSDSIKQSMIHTINSYGRDPDVTSAWDIAQPALQCCGVEGFSAFKVWKINEDGPFNDTNQVPKSCCKWNDKVTLNICLTNPNYASVFSLGCFDAIYAKLNSYSGVIGAAGLGMGLVMGLGMAFTLILFNTAKNPARTAPEVEKKKDGNEKPKETKPAEKAAEKPAAKPAEEPKKT